MDAALLETDATRRPGFNRTGTVVPLILNAGRPLLTLHWVLSRLFVVLAFLGLVLCCDAFAKPQDGAKRELQQPPYLRQIDGVHELIVDGKPFLIRGGELHNSTSSSIEYMNAQWAAIKRSNVNTVLAAVTWQQFEPNEGVFDFEVLDNLIAQAERHDVRLIVLWFGSWKNGQSSYAPLWVKTDTARFPRVKKADGSTMETLSVFSPNLIDADRRAYTALSRRIALTDKTHRVIMMQPENEVGLLGTDYDYSQLGRRALENPVAPELMRYLQVKKASLRPELASVWAAAGNRNTGSWKEVFGDTPKGREILLAWNYAKFFNALAQSGRTAYDLPTYVNAWIVQNEKELPGDYPAGGPVSRVMDVYKAAAPHIDFLSPDIYLSDFKSIAADYVREDNPLFIPESTIDAGRAFYTIGALKALGFSPFGIEDAVDNPTFGSAYGVLAEIEDVILSARRKPKHLFAALRQGNQRSETFDADDIQIVAEYTRQDTAAYGIIARVGPDEFFVAGANLNVAFKSTAVGKSAFIVRVDEGRFDNGSWRPGRLLNGDETFHNEKVRVFGRTVVRGPTLATDVDLPPQPTPGQAEKSSAAPKLETPPGIYRVRLYRR